MEKSIRHKWVKKSPSNVSSPQVCVVSGHAFCHFKDAFTVKHMPYLLLTQSLTSEDVVIILSRALFAAWIELKHYHGKQVKTVFVYMSFLTRLCEIQRFLCLWIFMSVNMTVFRCISQL